MCTCNNGHTRQAGASASEIARALKSAGCCGDGSILEPIRNRISLAERFDMRAAVTPRAVDVGKVLLTYSLNDDVDEQVGQVVQSGRVVPAVPVGVWAEVDLAAGASGTVQLRSQATGQILGTELAEQIFLVGFSYTKTSTESGTTAVQVFAQFASGAEGRILLAKRNDGSKPGGPGYDESIEAKQRVIPPGTKIVCTNTGVTAIEVSFLGYYYPLS